jgi:integrase
MAQGRITKRVVDGLKATGAEQFMWDTEVKGFGVRVQASGAKSYVFKYSHGTGRSAPTRRMTLARVGNVTPEEARGLAKREAGKVAHGADPVRDRRKAKALAENTLRSVTESYFAREGDRLRSAAGRRAAFERLVFPVLGARQIGEIKRSDIIKLLDKIEEERGAPTASLTLAYISKVFNWYAIRTEDFRSPIVVGMRRGEAVKRDRVLTDEELRAFWRAAEGWDHAFSLMLRFILLTATRRDEAADMRWSETNGDVWTIPASRYKTNIDFELPLSRAARAVMPAVRIGDAGFVFTVSGKHGMQGFSKFKAEFDGRMLAELRKMEAKRGEPEKVTIERWTIHDLRRTARSLMTRAGIAPDHAERALGHVIAGVRGVYDRHRYYTEKQKAFEALAAQVEHILNPADNVAVTGDAKPSAVHPNGKGADIVPLPQGRASG